ncbi:trans-L-3-hydroxyproline dehydratase-like [Lineus longissimus]|uniref:trans-L-3-hydroxyproline dehydratase-like n=1 Tax=Lineus longissimus TaxID=88925 RepID=UPI00315D2113
MDEGIKIKTVEMHTGGEPLRIVESGLPEIKGATILEKRKYAKEHLDHIRKVLMREPRGHLDMYGTYLVEPDLPEADLAVLFTHNEGYSTMCGHATIALGRYAVDKGLVKDVSPPEVEVKIQAPPGLLRVWTKVNEKGRSGSVRFHSIPSFAAATDVKVNVPNNGEVTLDVGFGGTFYAVVPASRFELDLDTSPVHDLIKVGMTVRKAVSEQVKVKHPDFPELEFIYGTILTDGSDQYSDKPTKNVCIFADNQVDRSPTGSGVIARIALQHHKGLIKLNQVRCFTSIIGSVFTGMAVEKTKCGDNPAVVVEVSGTAYYTGSSTFTVEAGDELAEGFLPRM